MQPKNPHVAQQCPAAHVIKKCVPRVVHVSRPCRSAGLVLCTYGKLNNNAENCKLQRRHGVSAVIVDHVAHIASSMQATASASAKASAKVDKAVATTTTTTTTTT